MERPVHVHFLRPDSFYGKIDLPENWGSMDEDERVDWLSTYFQANQGIRAVEVEEYDAY